MLWMRMEGYELEITDVGEVYSSFILNKPGNAKSMAELAR
jgi:hypothetical protein